MQINGKPVTIPAGDWLPAVQEFVTANLPRDRDGDWDHYFISAFQMGCELLDALGCARETDRGAIPVTPPHVPLNPPRWDDACVVVLKLSEQIGELDFHPLGQTSSDRAKFLTINTPLPSPNIAAGSMPGPGCASPDVQNVLHALGLLDRGGWNDVAEAILWRNWPYQWPKVFETDARVLAGIEAAVEDAPEAVMAKILRLLTVSDEEVALSAAKTGRTLSCTREAIRKVRRHDVEWLFFTSWRLGDGWVTDHSRGRPLEIFHDDLAMTTCDGVLEKLMGQSS